MNNSKQKRITDIPTERETKTEAHRERRERTREKATRRAGKE